MAIVLSLLRADFCVSIININRLNSCFRSISRDFIIRKSTVRPRSVHSSDAIGISNGASSRRPFSADLSWFSNT